MAGAFKEKVGMMEIPLFVIAALPFICSGLAVESLVDWATDNDINKIEKTTAKVNFISKIGFLYNKKVGTHY
jgi:hypothetical protein